jgi:sulfatase maturation enzyme AslB (radical SAM superfamily)
MENNLIKKRKEFRSFKELDFYDLKETESYNLMPFKFHRLNKKSELLVNEVGDFLIVPSGTAEKIILRKINKKEDQELYADLISNYFICEEKYSPLIDILATRYLAKKSFLESFTGLHIFVISLRCEHTCHYCQVSRVTEDKGKYDMSRGYIDKGIDFMMKSPNPNVTMEFQGGEALLAFDNIKYAVDRAISLAPIYGKNITYVICTNLAVVTEEILKKIIFLFQLLWMARNMFMIKIDTNHTLVVMN